MRLTRALATTVVAAVPLLGLAGSASSAPTSGVRFSPPTLVSAAVTAAEPIIRTGTDGSLLVGANNLGLPGVLARSTDGGSTFSTFSTADVGPSSLPTTDLDLSTDDQGFAYHNESVGPLLCAVSNDELRTWRTNPSCVQMSVDRQWLVVDNGTTPAATDNTVFLIGAAVPINSAVWSSPGSTGATDPVGGLVFSLAGTLQQAPGSLRTSENVCARPVFDARRRDLIAVCTDTGETATTVNDAPYNDHLTAYVAHVAPGQRTGLTFSHYPLPQTPSGQPTQASNDYLPIVSEAQDSAGNLYATWTDRVDGTVYLSSSRDGARHWSAPFAVSGPETPRNLWAWVSAGDKGRVAVTYWGSPRAGDPYAFTSWYKDPVDAGRYPWYGYAAIVTGADTSTPTVDRTRFSDAPLHYGEVCRNNNDCLEDPDRLQGGQDDLSAYDFFSSTIDRHGRLVIASPATSNQYHGGLVEVFHQTAGPRLRAGGSSHAAPREPSGDAIWPRYGATAPGPDYPALDLTGARVEESKGHLRAVVSVQDLSSADRPAGDLASRWILRFFAASTGDHGEPSERLFYLGAEQYGGQWTFFAGSPAGGAGPDSGCVDHAGFCTLLRYPAQIAAAGRVEGNRLIVDVPVGALGHPLSRLTGAYAATETGPAPDAELDVVDTTAPWDVRS